VPLQKPWQDWQPGKEHERHLSNTLGVYEIADESGETVYIGFAGGKSHFGLRGELKRHFDGAANAVTAARGRRFRYEIDVTTSRWLALSAASKADQAKPFRTEAAMWKLVGTEASGRVMDRSIQIHGGLGVSKDLPLERWYRELRSRRISEGPSEVQRIIMARDLLHAGLP